MSKESIKSGNEMPENFLKVKVEQLELQNKSFLSEVNRLK